MKGYKKEAISSTKTAEFSIAEEVIAVVVNNIHVLYIVYIYTVYQSIFGPYKDCCS